MEERETLVGKQPHWAVGLAKEDKTGAGNRGKPGTHKYVYHSIYSLWASARGAHSRESGKRMRAGTKHGNWQHSSCGRGRVAAAINIVSFWDFIGMLWMRIPGCGTQRLWGSRSWYFQKTMNFQLIGMAWHWELQTKITSFTFLFPIQLLENKSEKIC